jgi:hypothetical protein
LDATQAGHYGIEKIEQQQRGVLIVEQFSVACAIALRARIVKSTEQWTKYIEILEGTKILLGELRLGSAEQFVEFVLPLLSSRIFWRWDGDCSAPSTWIGNTR